MDARTRRLNIEGRIIGGFRRLKNVPMMSAGEKRMLRESLEEWTRKLVREFPDSPLLKADKGAWYAPPAV
jgi:hypothetical protein